MRETFLVVVEESKNRELISAILRKDGYPIVEAESGQRGLDLLNHQPDIACVLAQIDLADMKGVDFVTRIHAVNAHVPIIMLVKSETEPRLPQALDSGADDFVLMPPSPLRLKVTLNNLMRQRSVKNEASRVRRYAENHLNFKDLVAKSAKMRDLIAKAKQAVRRPTHILISGEAGCEHELIARIIHRENRSRRGIFVRFQCLDEPSIGQDWQTRLAAKLIQAHEGSLCLVDIDRLGKVQQQHLVETIEQMQMGGHQDVRFMATTTAIREDLAKLNPHLLALLEGTRLELSPLRERQQDIEELCHIILKVVIAETGRQQISAMGSRALALCQAYDWPGNLAELENSLFRAVLLSDGPVLSVQDFPQIWRRVRLKDMKNNFNEDALPSFQDGAAFWDESGHIRQLSDIEKSTIEAALQRYGGHLSEVARRLGLSRATLYRKIESYRIKNPVER